MQAGRKEAGVFEMAEPQLKIANSLDLATAKSLEAAFVLIPLGLLAAGLYWLFS